MLYFQTTDDGVDESKPEFSLNDQENDADMNIRYNNRQCQPWFNTYSMKTYVLLRFEHKNYVTIIIKLPYRATSRRRVAL